MKKPLSFITVALSAGLATVLGAHPQLLIAQDKPPKFETDPSWPKPLPEGWITGQLGGVCVDSHDHVIVVNRGDITNEEKETSLQAPPIIMFDAAGNVVSSMEIRMPFRTQFTAAPLITRTIFGLAETATASFRSIATKENSCCRSAREAFSTPPMAPARVRR